MSKLKIYIRSILIPVALGAVVGFLTAGSMDYQSLQKPALAPPGILFPIVWSILYVLMGISYGILTEKGLLEPKLSAVYYIQLGVNLLWPILFFTLEWRLFAFVWILLLDALVAAMVVLFYRKNKLAGVLQLPYLAWVLFASYLNLAFFILNG